MEKYGQRFIVRETVGNANLIYGISYLSTVWRKCKKRKRKDITIGSYRRTKHKVIQNIMVSDSITIAIIAGSATVVVNIILIFCGWIKLREQLQFTQDTNKQIFDQQEQAKKEKFDQKEYAKKKEQEKTAQALVDKARRPLLNSAMELLSTIDKILRKDYLDYSPDNKKRKDLAIQSTLYDFSTYWHLSYKLYDKVDLLLSSDDIPKEGSKLISGQLIAVSKICSKCELTEKLMMWRPEQRAIGELMQDDKGEPIGFLAFVKDYVLEKDYMPENSECTYGLSHWLEEFAADLAEQLDEKTKKKLKMLGKALSGLIIQLDKDNVRTVIGSGWHQWLVKEYKNAKI